MYSVKDDTELTVPGCPIQKSPGQRMFSSLPRLIAAFHVFLLHLTPRHPPFALSSLATIPQISLNALMFFENFVKFGVAAQNFLNDVVYYYDLLKNFACALNFTKISKKHNRILDIVDFSRAVSPISFNIARSVRFSSYTPLYF